MKVAVVGLGYWGPNLVRNLHLLESCTGVVACDLDERRVKAVLRHHPHTQTAQAFHDVLGDETIDAVVLATPVNTHFALASAALRAGKHVLVEKPLATSKAAADELIATARDRQVLVVAGHTFLHSPSVMAVREMLRDGSLGEPLYVQGSRVNLGIHQSEVSVLWDLAPHDLSILLDWLDEWPAQVSATGRSTMAGRPPDVAFLSLTFPSGVIANLHLSWLAPTKVRRMTIVCTKKMVVYEDTSSEEPVRIYDKGLDLPDPEDFGQYQLIYRTGDVVSLRVETWEPLRVELDDFLSRAARGDLPDHREETAACIVGVIEAAEQSFALGGRPVDL